MIPLLHNEVDNMNATKGHPNGVETMEKICMPNVFCEESDDHGVKPGLAKFIFELFQEIQQFDVVPHQGNNILFNDWDASILNRHRGLSAEADVEADKRVLKFSGGQSFGSVTDDDKPD
ncbi:hypothetical protein LINPERPRIM_LOCUS16792 [Linum perenne]